MKRILFFLMAIISFFMIYGLVVAHDNHGAKKGFFTKHFNDSLFKITENGLFSVEILTDEREYKIGKDVIGIVIHDENDKDLEGVAISISLEGIIGKSFVIKEKGDGLYTVSNLNLIQESNLKLIITVKKNKKQDRAIFFFPEVLLQKIPAGKYEFKNAHHPHRHKEYAKIKNPIMSSALSISKGRDIFTRYCANCHAESAKGDMAPDLTDDLWIHGNTDGEIFHVIMEGVPRSSMRGFKNELSTDMIWHTVNYLKSLKALNRE